MLVSLIVAVSENGVIGRQGELPWHLSSDLRLFKRRTLGHHILMGRRTYESIGRPLPGRISIVISRDPRYQAAGCQVASTWPEALRLAAGDEELFVIGGRQIYTAALPDVERLYWTRVHAEVEGDTFFPAVDWSHWQLIEQQACVADDRNDYPCTFQVFQRVQGGA